MRVHEDTKDERLQTAEKLLDVVYSGDVVGEIEVSLVDEANGLEVLVRVHIEDYAKELIELVELDEDLDSIEKEEILKDLRRI